MENLTNESRLDKRLYETQWSRQLAREYNTPEDHARWLSYSSVDRLYLGIGYKIVHWEFQNGANTIIDSFTLSRIEVDAENTSYIFDSNSGLHTVSHIPKLFADTGVFLWVPYFNEFRHVPGGWDRVSQPGYLNVSLCAWQRSNPTKNKQSGHAYMTTLKCFESSWAGQKSRS